MVGFFFFLQKDLYELLISINIIIPGLFEVDYNPVEADDSSNITRK